MVAKMTDEERLLFAVTGDMNPNTADGDWSDADSDEIVSDEAEGASDE